MTLQRRISWSGLVALLVMAAGTAQAEWKFSGYTQARYNFWDSDLSSSHDSFDLRRARIKAEGNVSDATTMKIQFDLAKLDDDGGNVELKDLVFTHQLNDQWKGSMGFTSVPFGFEVPYSSSKRLTLERSRAANVLFPGERDTGLYFHYKSPAEKMAWEAVFGVSNGMRNWYDADSSGNEDTDSMAYMARLQVNLPNKSVAGVSFRSADRDRMQGGSLQNFSDDLLGLHVRYHFPKNFAVQGEYYDGENLGTDVKGWLAQGEYAFDNQPVTAFYRYDVYDFGGSDDYSRNTFGVAWDRNKSERITLQAEDYDDGKGHSYTNFGFQYQYMY